MSDPKIVSLWAKVPANGNFEFLGSGCLIDRRTVLTAYHVVDEHFHGISVDGTYWVGLVDGVSEKRRCGNVVRHPDYDVALLRCEEESPRPVPTPWFLDDGATLDGTAVELHVVSPLSKNASKFTNYSIGNFDGTHGEYELAPECAKGHSGGLVLHRGRVVGLLDLRAKNDPLCRAVAVARFIDWLRHEVPGLAVTPGEALIVRQVADEVKELLAAEDLRPLRDVWGTDPVRGRATADAWTLIGNLRVAIDKALLEWLQLRMKADRPKAVQDTCRSIAASLFRLAIDRPALHAWLAANGTPVYPCRSATTAAFLHAVCSQITVRLAQDRDKDGVRTDRVVDLKSIDAGVGRDQEALIHKALWPMVRPEDDYPEGGSPLSGSILEDFIADIESLTFEGEGNPCRRFIIAAETATEAGRGDLGRIAEDLGTDAVLRVGAEGGLLVVAESKLLSALKFCMDSIRKIK